MGPSLVMAGILLISLIFWAGVIVVGAYLIKGGAQERGNAPSRALAVLEERYARGEIDRDEFVERRRTLLSGGAEPRSRVPGSSDEGAAGGRA